MKTQQKNEKEQIKKRYTRIHENIKEIRQQFSPTVTSGRRSEEVILNFTTNLFKFGVAHQRQNHFNVVQAGDLLILLKMKVTEAITIMMMDKEKVVGMEIEI